GREAETPHRPWSVAASHAYWKDPQSTGPSGVGPSIVGVHSVGGRGPGGVSSTSPRSAWGDSAARPGSGGRTSLSRPGSSRSITPVNLPPSSPDRTDNALFLGRTSATSI
ncbi:unnamed protein product, partial [Meganyctiphanes norvegica]